MQKISTFFLTNFLKQDVLYINQKNKLFKVNPIYFLINLKQILRLKNFQSYIGIYITDKQCRIILQNLLKNSKIIFLSDENIYLKQENISVIFYIQINNFCDKSLINLLKTRKTFFIKISSQVQKKHVSEPFYSILLDSFNVKNMFFLVTFFRFFSKC
jgi:hypothetical protein